MRFRVGFKQVVRFCSSRGFAFGFIILAQLLLLMVAIQLLAQAAFALRLCLHLVSLGVAIWVVTKEDNPSYKLAWVTVLLSLPLFGGLLYLLLGNKRLPRSIRRRLHPLETATLAQALPGDGGGPALTELDCQLGVQADYVRRSSGFPVWGGTDSRYLPTGEAFFAALLEELGRARHFILMEYFILTEGVMWEAIFSLLKEKVAQGVAVYLLYDDMGCMNTLPPGYHQVLREAGVRTTVFNPITPHLNLSASYRDHRKICVVDGVAGFCGGANLADEYINVIEKHGHWKDTAVLLRGRGAQSLTRMFCSLWEFSTGQAPDLGEPPPAGEEQVSENPALGFVQPFGDNPLDSHNVAEMVYLQILSRACRYVYITTPYLILDHEMVTALSLAAASGVDVRILTPHLGDRWYVHGVTRAHYPPLLRAGVRIFEYTPGFLHAKMFVSDDKVAVVGTANMDYRSFYLHFECGVSFYHSPVVGAVRDDILATIDLSEEVTLERVARVPLIYKIQRSILRLFAPLL